jgi:monoamine oxidase
MPTLYTALLARHRPQPAIPAAHIPGAKPTGRKAPLIATEQLYSVALPKVARPRRKSPKKQVIVVGAGFAGLCAAYELRGLRYEVKVFEARDRVGGRVHSLAGLVSNKIVEAGGELIGANHPLWLSYHQHFRLRLTDAKDYGNSPIRIQGQTLTSLQSQALMDEIDVQLKVLTDLARTIVDPYEPWTNHNAKHLDSLSLKTWLSHAKCSGRCKHAISVMMATDNGIPASNQSLLGVLAMIKGGGLDRYWTDTELYRCEGGNQQLAKCFRDRLNKRRPRTVVTRAAVRRIERKNGKAFVTVRMGKRL